MIDDKFSTRPKRKKTLNILPKNPDSTSRGRFPMWLHRPLPKGENLFQTSEILRKYNLNTVCEEAKCPNRNLCYSNKTATFLVLGKQCTRACGFCDIDFSKTPLPPEENEPIRIALSVKELGLKHVVLTMVSRDDLEDGGASHLRQIVEAIRKINTHITIELLTSDFAGNNKAIELVLNTNPEIFNHNIESVRRLTPKVRHKATYDRTLSVLQKAKNSNQASFIKSGLMLGFGETEEEVKETIADLKNVGCDIITMGQYLQASRLKLPVVEFISPKQFKEYENYGYSIGIKYMHCGPFVRSSFNAKQVMELFLKDGNSPSRRN